jgi:hypothetical protein
VINDQENPAAEMGEEGQEVQGQEEEGNQGSGKPVHNFSPQFLEEVLKQQQAEGNEKFVKDLNVIMQDEHAELPDAEEQQAQQYQLTEQIDKNATNLPFMDDQPIKQEEELLEAQDERQ